MAATHVAKVTFTRGEVTPLVHARIDVDLYKAAARTLQNWYVLKEGGIRRRSGTKYLGTIKSATLDTRLIDFIYSSSQSYALEMGNLYTRFWTNGGQLLNTGVPYEIVSPFATADLRSIQWAQSFDVMFFAHASNTLPVQKLKRNGTTNWTWGAAALVDGPYLPINDQDNTVSFSALPYAGTTVTFTHANVTNINGGAGFASTDVGRHYRIELQGSWSWGKISTIVSPTAVAVEVEDSNFSVNSGTSTWSRAAGYTTIVPTGGAQLQLVMASGANSFTNTDVGKLISVSLNDGSYTAEYFCALNSIDGNAGDLINVTFQSAIVPGTSASKSWQLGAFSDTTGYPRSISWFQGRLFLAGTAANPNAAWYSRSGLPENFAPSDFDGTVVDSHGGMLSMLGRADEILWMAEAPRLQLGTTGAIRTLGASDTQQAFGPRNVSQRLEVAGGVEDVPPVLVGQSAIHVAKYGKKINDLYFDYQVNSLIAPALSTTSEHMFDAGIKELWYQQSPDSQMWSILNDGSLVATARDQYEKVIGFSRQPLAGGNVISGCTIPGPTQDDFYTVVRRTINSVQVQYMELMRPRFLRGSLVDAWFVDCGGQYTGAASNTVSGITWLHGATVNVLADGIPFRGLTVSTGGVLTLPGGATAAKITFGVPIANEFGVLSPPIDAPDGSSKGRKMRVIDVIADVYETLGLKFTSDRGQSDQLAYRAAGALMGSPDALITGPRKVKIDGSWASTGQFTGSIDDPVPGTIRCLDIGLDYEP